MLHPTIKGLDPNGTDLQREHAEADWLRKHPALRILSEAEKAVRAERMAQSLGRSTPPPTLGNDGLQEGYGSA